MEVEQLLQMLKETDDPAVRERIAGEFPADPKLKGVFEKTYQNYLHAAGQERKKSGGFFRLSHAIGIAACMVLVVGVYLTMKIPHERLPSVIEETTTVSETMGEMRPTEPHPEATEPESVTEPASSDMGVSTGETAETMESVTEPLLTEPAGSTAPHASETAVTAGTTQEMQTMTTAPTIESEEASGTSVMTNPMTTPPTTAATTVRTSEPTESPVTQTMVETVLMTTEETIFMTTDEILLPENTEPTAESIQTGVAETTGKEMTECTMIEGAEDCTENPTEETTTTTTTAPDDGTLPEYAVQVSGEKTTVTYYETVAALRRRFAAPEEIRGAWGGKHGVLAWSD